ncbi:MAG: urea ABC transporter permease subunit UrtB [Candidatus Thiodiazotropha lotti]|uniref:Urea ABC transporter permease subunit UrtB n=1 Tax=Candidatus Thiodiazotropha endoloripes TaxID=1818881 RepID=A0A1E2UP90_9GAMM|nr:urea ABC transporter permease subunit UrtB [Candidatus Thiodiazotropha endoloripes]MCG7900487.1 urea ABC transporter permease subunit UrtB [Candidatus Thiodiazotropha weberae]MCG7929990.1 urea ABC transporter permease subunit UrtB [Candidatus Thiodiazotropha lotti]MCG7903872.1 urea ABC transporter permease subunit UrtB [Candidatus Thiodiazotropha weberae]MCG7914493.1 urea ABC transporter permease subunit UrtB [Candidatus Thiodiazotropha weberae]MCG7993597.1 urea ABC transporter permease sub
MTITKQIKTIILLLVLLLAPGTSSFADASEPKLDQAVELLKGKKFQQKYQAIELLAETATPQAQNLLKALLERRLFKWKKTKQLVIAEKQGKTYQIQQAVSQEALGEVKKRALKKISVNNKMRTLIRSALASFDLKSPDREKRLAAIQQILNKADIDKAEIIRPMFEQEQDGEIREAMSIIIALSDLSSEDKQLRSDSVKLLSGNIHPSVRNALNQLQQQTEDEALARSIKQALDSIDAKLQFYAVIENLFFGLSLGSVLVLAAIGLAITFGVMGVINMAHGELIMIGAYTTYVIQLLMPESIGTATLIAIPTAFVVSGLVGIAIERGVIRFLYGRSLETLLATFGISLILQQTVRSIFSPLNRSVETPSWMSGAWEINSALSLTLNRLYIIVFCLLVFAALFFVLKKTALGLQVRAVSQNRAMARAMGVRSEWVDAMTFGLGSGVAGIAGVALSQLTNVGPNLGQSYIIDSFMVVVFGGVGNLWGTLVSGMSLGVANKFLEPWSGAVLAKILVLVFIILFIQKRPKGLFPQKGRAAEG